MSESSTERNTTPAPTGGARRRPAVRMVLKKDRDWKSTAASVLLHALVIVLVFMPSNYFPDIDDEGAGGAGPAGGGGGGHGGTGGNKTAQERLEFFVAVPVAIPQIVPPVIEKKPEVVPPPVVEPPKPVEPPKQDSVVTTNATAEVKAQTTGTGGGSGNDSTDGSGPGRGGGVGSGVGTGRGSGVGPGTGGGSGTTYPPSPRTLVLLPTPVPARARPYDGRACFLVDSIGRATLLHFTRSKDAGYNKKIEESLRGYKFSPAVRLDGTPVADSTCVGLKAG